MMIFDQDQNIQNKSDLGNQDHIYHCQLVLIQIQFLIATKDGPGSKKPHYDVIAFLPKTATI